MAALAGRDRLRGLLARPDDAAVHALIYVDAAWASVPGHLYRDRELLLHGLADLEAAGATGLALDAVAANDAALRLYRSVGLAVRRERRVDPDLTRD